MRRQSGKQHINEVIDKKYSVIEINLILSPMEISRGFKVYIL
jgi:hypothetical protein